MALQHLMNSDLSTRYEFVRMHQDRATGSIDGKRILEWTRFLRDIRPDLVHVRGLGNEGFHAAWAARRAGCDRVLVSVHGTVRDLTQAGGLKHRVVRDVLEPRTLRLASHVTTVCRSAADRDFIRRNARRIVGPMPNGVDLPDLDVDTRSEARRALGLRDGTLVIVTVGRLSWEKGHRSLADALSRAARRLPEDTMLLVVGDGPDRDEIERIYAGCGVRSAFLGRRLDVPAILSASDLFVFPSLHENLSNALLEAMAHRLPVIATSVGGNVEVIEHGGGILVPAADPEGMAEEIAELAPDTTRRTALGRAARRTVEDHYSIPRMTEAVDRIYSAIIGA